MGSWLPWALAAVRREAQVKQVPIKDACLRCPSLDEVNLHTWVLSHKQPSPFAWRKESKGPSYAGLQQVDGLGLRERSLGRKREVLAVQNRLPPAEPSPPVPSVQAICGHRPHTLSFPMRGKDCRVDWRWLSSFWLYIHLPLQQHNPEPQDMLAQALCKASAWWELCLGDLKLCCTAWTHRIQPLLSGLLKKFPFSLQSLLCSLSCSLLRTAKKSH